ncbi:DNA-binding protein [Paenibacillus peoriae]|uniref:hypothetical protein n=1 Tax=Paenibacillus peoriae TaxID=59893 RepID=UPI00026C58A0|nr:hypothetical protein [Paenibacillus peoriae]MEC0182001.1 DNA-binding protein [Paenibacillus peoriae]
MEQQIHTNEEIYLLSENNHSLDKAFELFRLCYRQSDWDEANRIANYIHITADRMYKSRQKWGDIVSLNQRLKRPLVFYFGYSYLAKSIVFQRQGLFEQAREYVAKYADLGWYKEPTKEDMEEVEHFEIFAKANLYAIDLLSGNKEKLTEYKEFIKDNDEETLPGLINILEAANLNEWNVDDLIYEHTQQFETFASLEDIGNRVYYTKLLNQLAIYNLNHLRYGGAIDYILEFMRIAVTINLHKEIITIISMFDAIRSYATSEQQLKYQNILRGVLLNEENISNYIHVDNIS